MDSWDILVSQVQIIEELLYDLLVLISNKRKVVKEGTIRVV
jgi:hypothetical protein